MAKIGTSVRIEVKNPDGKVVAVGTDEVIDNNVKKEEGK